MKRELIDLESPTQAEVDEAIAEGVHAPVQEPALVQKLSRVPEVQSHTCAGRFGQCELDPFHTACSVLAREFARQVSARDLPVGSLVRLMPKHRNQQEPEKQQCYCYYFLGTLCKKPLLHTLVEAVPCEDHGVQQQAFTFNRTCDDLPCFTTTFQACRDILSSIYDSDMQVSEEFALRVESLEYKFQLQLFSSHAFEACILHTGPSFTLSLAQEKAKAKVQVRLPFGLKRQKRPRAKKVAQPKQGRFSSGPGGSQVKKPRQHPRPATGSDADLVEPQSGPRAQPGSPAAASSTSLSSSSTSSSSSSSCHSGSDVEVEGVGGGSFEVEVEATLPPTKVAQAEEQQMLREFESYTATIARKQDLAEQHQHQLKQPRPSGAAAATSSFFAKKVGFQEGSTAASGHSVCYHCNKKIAKGSVRFSYYHDVKRPSRWLHGSCIVDFVLACPEERKEQAVHAMLEIAVAMGGRSSSSSSSSGESLWIKREAEDILSHLT